ncbi:hypothetical protein EYC84_008679 [Monilinia fructicola]|uniref:Uncharacterized protein n=1 Tax=Monilinia fructicola TaxID=38448 RepID=A0A5M9JFZ8_MONFR|nr:hypothetical protein EYC84_008679 [Monilinia fructicola]
MVLLLEEMELREVLLRDKIPVMFRANSLDKVLVKLVKLVLSVMTQPAQLIISANTFQRVTANLDQNAQMSTTGHLNLGGRINPDPYHGQGSALTSSFARAQGIPPSPYGQPYGPFTTQEDGFVPIIGRQQSVDINIPTIDTSYASHAGSNYGSPRDDMMDRFGLGLSPVAAKGLSVMDVPLPASFDSNGVSWIARHGPVASSVPTKFGIDSPPSSVGAAKPSDALRNLHSSAFGDDTKDRFNGTASSPPSEYYGKRTMHSHRMAKPKIMSASLPQEQDWSEAFTFEEDLLPESLNDLMTPAEKARRGSRAAYDESKPTRGFYDEVRSTYSGAGTPINDTPKNSALHRTRVHRDGARTSNRNTRRKMRRFPEHQHSDMLAPHFGTLFFMKEQVLAQDLLLVLTPLAMHLHILHLHLVKLPCPSFHNSSSETRLARAESNGSEPSLLSSSAARTTTTPIGSGRSAFSADRQASSNSIGGSGRFTTPIDEEQGDFVFNMEGMDDDEKSQKKSSGAWNIGGSSKSPSLGAVGGGRNNSANKTNGSGLDGMFGGR